MFELYDIKNVDDFAKIMFQGKMSYGSITSYNDAWKEFANTNQEAQIHFVSYEDLSQNTSRNVSEIADFLGLKNVDITKVVAGSKFDSKDQHFKTKDQAAHKDVVITDKKLEDGRLLVKRKGKTDTWKSELTEDSLKYYRKYFE